MTGLHLGRYFAAFAVMVLIVPVMAAGLCGCESGKENEKLSDIQEVIARFRDGEEFDGDAGRFLVDGGPDEVALGAIDSALVRESGHVREQLCHLLADMGRRADALYAAGGGLIRVRSIVDRLAGELIATQTSERDVALDYLFKSVPASSLRGYGEALAENLRLFPDTTLMLVIAKAKTGQASETLGKLMENPGWAKEPPARIAAAALGDEEMEKEFIAAFTGSTDPGEIKTLAKQLGYIGTEKALTAVAGRMRTDLVLENPNVTRRSVRIFLIEALSFNYPELTFLYDNAVNSDEDYERIEKFCEDTFGVTWERERPPFLWIEGFPSTGPGE